MILILVVFFSFGAGVSAAYVLLSSVGADNFALASYQARDIVYEDIKVRGVVAQVDVQTRTLLLESPSPFSPVTKTRLRIGYGGKGISGAAASSTGVFTRPTVGSLVSILVGNQPGPLQANFIRAAAPRL